MSLLLSYVATFLLSQVFAVLVFPFAVLGLGIKFIRKMSEDSESQA